METAAANNGVNDVAGDLLYGAEEIGKFLFGPTEKRRARRAVYHLATEVDLSKRLPVFRMGAIICARRSTLVAWIAAREAA